MSGLSKLGAALTIIFAFSLVAVFAQLFYVLWRRRFFHPQTPPQTATATAPSNSHTFSDSSSNLASSMSFSSRELLHFFCLSSSRVEPTSTPPTLNSTAEEDDMEVIDIFKLQNMRGPSRVLFTIKEEDTENDVESEKSAVCSSATKKPDISANRVSLEECFKATDDGPTGEEAAAVVAVAVGDDHIMNNAGDQIGVMTPISTTPCESPLYFTPPASPIGGELVRC